MSRGEVEELIGSAKTATNSFMDLELELQIERGALNPMENFEPSYESPSGQLSTKRYGQSEKVTIVLDPNLSLIHI